MVKLFTFREHEFEVTGAEHDLLYLADILREAGAEGTLGDLCYQIDYHFDVDGVRTENEKCMAADTEREVEA